MSRRWIACALMAISCTAAVGEGKSMGEGNSSEALLRKKAPRGAVILRPKCAVAGADLFFVALPARGPDDSHGYGAAVLDGKLLVGKDGLKAALAHGGARPPGEIACLASLLVGDAGEPVVDPARDVTLSAADEKALARAPSREGDVVEYWAESAPSRRPGLRRYRFTLATLALSSESAQQVLAQGRDPLDQAGTLLASHSSFSEKEAIRLLAERCHDDPRAAQLLIQTLRTHASADTREGAAVALGACRSAAAVPALIAALADPSSSVRWNAADALGSIGDRSARAPLEKLLASDPEQSPRTAAQRALEKLKR